MLDYVFTVSNATSAGEFPSVSYICEYCHISPTLQMNTNDGQYSCLLGQDMMCIASQDPTITREPRLMVLYGMSPLLRIPIIDTLAKESENNKVSFGILF